MFLKFARSSTTHRKTRLQNAYIYIYIYIYIYTHTHTFYTDICRFSRSRLGYPKTVTSNILILNTIINLEKTLQAC